MNKRQRKKQLKKIEHNFGWFFDEMEEHLERMKERVRKEPEKLKEELLKSECFINNLFVYLCDKEINERGE